MTILYRAMPPGCKAFKGIRSPFLSSAKGKKKPNRLLWSKSQI